MQPTVSVVVPMLNASPTIERTLSSLVQQEFDAPWQLIVLDNGSADASVRNATSILERADHPNLANWVVDVVSSPQGYAAARNAGVERAAAPLIAFCDADDFVGVTWLSRLTAALADHPLIASKQVPMSDTATSSQFLDTEANRPFTLRTQLGVAVAHTGGMGCTRELFDALGGFDSYFDRGGEDADFSIRAWVSLAVQPVVEQRAIYWVSTPAERRASFVRGYRDGRSRVRLFKRHLGTHGEPESGPMATVRGLARTIRRLPRLRDPARRASIARATGFIVGRAAWSIRLRVRYF